MSQSIREITLHANDIDFVCRTAGSGPVVLCLHGFPDCYHSFDRLLPALADAGYKAVAPAMRGYAPSSFASDGRYGIRDLAADVTGLIDALGVTSAAVIGHDWGAVSTYAAAAMTPEKIACMVAVAVPPLRHIVMRPKPRQFWRSRYMLLFQFAGIAERHCLDNDLAYIEALWRDWCPGWSFSEQEFAPVRDAMKDPQRMQAALRYYRALPAAVFDSELRKRVLVPLTAAALVMNGETDGCFGPDMFCGLEHCFAGSYSQATIADAGHFMHREQPKQFAETVLGFLEAAYI